METDTYFTIEVSLLANLNKFAPKDGTVSLFRKATVKDLVRILGLQQDMVQMAFVDGTFTDLDSPLDNAKKVLLLPAIGGG